MKVIIVEDEILAVERLSNLIHQYDPDIEILATLDSVKETLVWFGSNLAPDLAFFDIQLADGLSFEIFEKIKVKCPVIFTTAYDQYALKAFKVNSIDYLLKPFDLEELSSSINQYKSLKNSFAERETPQDLRAIQTAMQMLTKRYKSRFMVKSGNSLHSILVEDILYFFSEQKIVWLRSKNGKKHAIDYTLDQLEGLLNSDYFFRINRKYIIGITSIEGVVNYSNSRLKLSLHKQEDKEPIVVSRERVSSFKRWMDQ